jgi:hypothetical protein
VYEQREPWQFRHCWEILKDEPRWNNALLEIQNTKKGKKKQATPETDTPTPTAPTASEPLERPEGRDSAKRRRARQLTEEASSSPAVEMLQKMHDRDQEMDERDNKQKEELMSIERTKVQIQQKSLDVQIEISEKNMQFKREQAEEERKLRREAMDVSRFETEARIMFTDPASTHPSLRFWIVKKQREILLKEGIDPSVADSQASSDPSSGAGGHA